MTKRETLGKPLDETTKNWNFKYNRPTLGQLIYDIRSNNIPPNTRNAVEIQRAKEKEHLKNRNEVIEKTKKITTKDFYVHVEKKIEPLLPEVERDYFQTKFDCPTPNYDQTVYFYNNLKDQLELVWTIPDRYTCKYLLQHKNELPTSEYELLNYVIRFKNRELFKEMKVRNGEKKDSPFLDK